MLHRRQPRPARGNRVFEVLFVKRAGDLPRLRRSVVAHHAVRSLALPRTWKAVTNLSRPAT